MMDRQSYRKKITREIFSFASKKKIIIYGTGKLAKLLVESLYDYNIAGVIDIHKVEGDFCGVPIITWDDMDIDTADILIIAARNDAQREIFHRIKHYSVMYDFRIYNVLGHEFTGEGYFKEYEIDEISSFNNTHDDLIKQIDAHDVISFDLYDTLIMRKVLEPTDVFDIVNQRIKEYGINVKDFKKNRRAAELESECKDIYHIYDILKTKLRINDEQANLILAEEIKCEKECTIPRREMVDVFNYSIKSGKTVSIISNMYLTSDIIEEIIKPFCITGYKNLLISCEQGCFKSNGLYNIYLSDLEGKSCLHIGDNLYEDGAYAEEAGIDTFHVNSALDMLKMSKMSMLLNYARGISNRLLIGLIVAELFNSPFSLAGYYGYVPISSMDRFTASFIAPIVTGYMQNLVEYINNNDFDGVIFPSRDGYIFDKLYRYMSENLKMTVTNKGKAFPDCFYLSTSRKISSSVSIYDEDDISDVELRLDCTEDRKAFWIELMGFESDCEFDIINESAIKRSNYLAYMRKLGINPDKRHLFCDLISRGTSHIALNRIFTKELKGYYLCRLTECCDMGDLVDCLCDETQRNNLSRYTDFIEAFITAPAPSADSVNSKGEILYKKENRSPEEISRLLDNQSVIEAFFKSYIGLINMPKGIKTIDGQLLETLTGLIGAVIPQDEVKDFLNLENVDSVLDDRFNIMRRIYH